MTFEFCNAEKEGLLCGRHKNHDGNHGIWTRKNGRPPWWWLSFADEKKPQGSQFLGAVLLEANDMSDAVLKSKRLGLNPGGEVLGAMLGGHKEPPKEQTYKLLSLELMEKMEMQPTRWNL